MNFSTDIYVKFDYTDVVEGLIITGALFIVAIVATEATPVVLANIEAIVYFVETYGIRQGLTMYSYLGIYNLPDGVITWIQMDMADGDSCVDDVIDSSIPIYQRGLTGEQALQEAHPGTPHEYFPTLVDGVKGGRYVDIYYENIAYEAKVGYTCLSQRIKIQILKDVWLLKNNPDVEGVVWEFFKSDITGRVGASQQLLDFLTANGIEYVIH